MRALVTGGCGFIGSFLAERLIDEGAEVHVLDNLTANVVDEVVGAYLIELDDWDIDLDDPWWQRQNYGLIYHCASPVGAVGVLRQRGLIVPDIIRGTQRVAALAERLGAKLINVSTSEVYGQTGVYIEEQPCMIHAGYTARREYAVAKLAAEYMLDGWDLGHTTVRPFNVAGPRQTSDKGFVLPTFAEQALGDFPLTVFGSGHQERAFTAVYDVINFLVEIAPRVEGTFNVGNQDNRTTILDLAHMLNEAAGQDPDNIAFTDGQKVWGKDYAEADGFKKIPDSSKALEAGWRPRTSLSALVDATLRETKETITS